MSSPQPAPPPQTPGDGLTDLAAQVAALRGQVRLIFARLDHAGITGERDLAAELAHLADIAAETLDTAPGAPAAPYWTGLDPDQHAAQLAELRNWVTIVLRPEYGGYELRGCWANHPHAIWELSTLAAEWHRTYSRKRPDLDHALKFYDRWLPETMHRISEITRKCVPHCTITQRPGKNLQT